MKLTKLAIFRFSPKDNLLAVGSDEMTVDFLEINSNLQMTRIGYCTQVPGPVLQFDWSSLGDYIKVSLKFY